MHDGLCERWQLELDVSNRAPQHEWQEEGMQLLCVPCGRGWCRGRASLAFPLLDRWCKVGNKGVCIREHVWLNEGQQRMQLRQVVLQAKQCCSRQHTLTTGQLLPCGILHCATALHLNWCAGEQQPEWHLVLGQQRGIQLGR